MLSTKRSSGVLAATWEPTKLPAKLGYEASGVRAREGGGEYTLAPWKRWITTLI